MGNLCHNNQKQIVGKYRNTTNLSSENMNIGNITCSNTIRRLELKEKCAMPVDEQNESPTRAEARLSYFSHNEFQVCRFKFNSKNGNVGERPTLAHKIKFIEERKLNMLDGESFSEGYCCNNNLKMLCHSITLPRHHKYINMRNIEGYLSLRKQLQHPNLMSYYGYDVYKNNLNMYYENSGSGSLADYMNPHQKLETCIIAYYAKQVLAGLEYLHANEIKHLAICPMNIHLFDGNVVKLGPFNFCKEIAELSWIYSVERARYASPEVRLAEINESVDRKMG